MVEYTSDQIRASRDITIPYPGTIFTAYAKENLRGPDPRIDGVFRHHTVYTKLKSIFWQGNLLLEIPFRFIVVSGPFESRRHNYANAAPFRPLEEGELTGLCAITSLESGIMKDAARGTRPQPNFVEQTLFYDFEHFRKLIAQRKIK